MGWEKNLPINVFDVTVQVDNGIEDRILASIGIELVPVVPVTLEEVVAEAGAGGVELRWSATLEEPVSFQVRRSTRDEGGFELVSGEIAGLPGRSRYSFLDRTVAPATRHTYVVAYLDQETWNYSGPVSIGTAGVEFAIRGVFPNPVHDALRIDYAIAQRGHAQPDIYDAAGRRVCRLLDGVVEPGLASAIWDGRGHHGRRVANGTYFARLQAGSKVVSHKLVLTH